MPGSSSRSDPSARAASLSAAACRNAAPARSLLPMPVYRETREDDERLSRVGILFCCGISILVFGAALRFLPIHQTLPRELEQVGHLVNLSEPGKLLTSTPVPSASILSTGTPVVISTPTAVPLLAATPTAQVNVPPSAPTPGPPAVTTQTYTVQRGDTLYSIARRADISPQALAAMNGRPADALVKTGETLRIR